MGVAPALYVTNVRSKILFDTDVSIDVMVDVLIGVLVRTANGVVADIDGAADVDAIVWVFVTAALEFKLLSTS